MEVAIHLLRFKVIIRYFNYNPRLIEVHGRNIAGEWELKISHFRRIWFFTWYTAYLAFPFCAKIISKIPTLIISLTSDLSVFIRYNTGATQIIHNRRLPPAKVWMAFRLIRDLYDSSKFVPFFLPALLFLRTLKSLLYSDTRAQIRDPAARLRRILHKGSALLPIGCIRCERDGGFRDYTYSSRKRRRQTDRYEYARRVIKSREFENQSPSAFRSQPSSCAFS